MRYAKVHVSIMGDETQQQLCLHGLRRAAGYLQKRVNDRIATRYTPRLQFVLDKGIKNAFKVAEILKQVLPEPAVADEDQSDDVYSDEEYSDEEYSDEVNSDEVNSDEGHTDVADAPGSERCSVVPRPAAEQDDGPIG
jgi:ribosome-binding factor A